MVCLSPVGYGVYLTFRALALRRFSAYSCSDEGLTLEKSAKHHIPQATNILYQPLFQSQLSVFVTRQLRS